MNGSNCKMTLEKMEMWIELLKNFLLYLDDDSHDRVVDDVNGAKKWVNCIIEQLNLEIEQLKDNRELSNTKKE